MRLKKFLESF